MAEIQRGALPMSAPASAPTRDALSTGVDGLDDIMAGGFTRRRLFLVEGVPGSGKTTLALQYLMAGARRGERGLYVTLSETAEELVAGAESHGWTLDGIDIRELTPPEGSSRRRRAEHDVPSVGGRAGLDDEADPGGRGAAEAHRRRLRFALRAAAPGRQRAALSSADSGAEAVLCDAPVHGASSSTT